MKLLKLLFCTLAFIITACGATLNPKDQIKSNITKGDEVVKSIEIFKTSNGHLPQNLNELQPKYLDKIPITENGGAFKYTLSESDGGFLLCFPRCCYLARFKSWDCSPGGD